MTILAQGFNRLRDLHHDDVDNCILGTDGTATSAAQTGLISEVTDSEKVPIKSKGQASLQLNYRLDSVSAVDETYREFTSRNASDLSYDRSAFPGVNHTSNDELIIIKTFAYRQG